jgi:hypothetical protein
MSFLCGAFPFYGTSSPSLVKHLVWLSILAIIQFFNKFHFTFIVKNQLIRSTIITKDYQVPWFPLAIVAFMENEETSHLEQEYVETFPCEYVDAQCIVDGFVWIVSYISTIQSIVVWKMDQLEDHGA